MTWRETFGTGMASFGLHIAQIDQVNRVARVEQWIAAQGGDFAISFYPGSGWMAMIKRDGLETQTAMGSNPISACERLMLDMRLGEQ